MTELIMIGWMFFAGSYAITEVNAENEELAEKAQIMEIASAIPQAEMEVAEFDAELDGDSVARK